VLFIDAPVSGSKGPAEAGELLILASGPPAAQPVADPVFAAIGPARSENRVPVLPSRPGPC
jgi:3-hydroxyisobutyrate dehydrogenase